MSSEGGEIAFYKRTLIENYESLFSISGTNRYDSGTIAERIRLLDTILMDEKQLKILLGYEKDKTNEKDKTFISFYYLLNKISNDEEDKRKLDEILKKANENTDKIKLLEVIVLKAQELISSITKEKERKEEAEKLIKKQKEIEDKKVYILDYINVNHNYISSKDKITVEDIEYSILDKYEKKESLRGETTITNYYLLYKKHGIYTMKTKRSSSQGDRPIIPPKLLDYDLDLDLTHLSLLDKLYYGLKNQTSTHKSGGKRIAHAASTAHTYKSTGNKVFLFIDNKRLHRSIYVKGNGKAKYCKINNEFILLSKLKNKVIE